MMTMHCNNNFRGNTKLLLAQNCPDHLEILITRIWITKVPLHLIYQSIDVSMHLDLVFRFGHG
jgi:hypothetical protein